MKYLKENGCPWDEETCYISAKKGYLHILKYLRQQGCPWDFRTCLWAAEESQADVLRWAIDNGCPEPDEEAIIAHNELHYSHYPNRALDYIRRKTYLLEGLQDQDQMGQNKRRRVD